MQADRHGRLGSPSVRGGIVDFEGRSNRQTHHIPEAGLRKPAHDVNLVGQRPGGHLGPLRRRRRRRAPDASIRLELGPWRGYRKRDEAETREDRRQD
jgi:hypothetical protein